MTLELRAAIDSHKAALSETWIDPDARYGPPAHLAQCPVMPDAGIADDSPVIPTATRWQMEATKKAICPKTRKLHYWRRSGLHHTTRQPQKKCRDCRTTWIIRSGDLVSGQVMA